MHVLLVDDNRVWRVRGTKFLQQAGCTVAVAEHGKQALDYLAASPVTCPRPDLILMDIAMPVVDGLQAVNIIRTQAPFNIDPKICSTPIVGLCATRIRADHERFIAQGFDDILAKPWSVHDVQRLVGWWSQRLLLPRTQGVAVAQTAIAPVWGKRSRM
ncbi:CheY-like superfamily [Aspergillus venezuelensis]